MIPIFQLIGLLFLLLLVQVWCVVQLLRWRRRRGFGVIFSVTGKVIASDAERATLVLQTEAGRETVLTPGANLCAPRRLRRRGIRVGDRVRVEGLAVLARRESLYRQQGLSSAWDALRVTPLGWRLRRGVACLVSGLALVALLASHWSVLQARLAYGFECPAGTRLEIRIEGDDGIVTTVACRRGRSGLLEGRALKVLHWAESGTWRERREQTYHQGRLTTERRVLHRAPPGENQIESGGFNVRGERHGPWSSSCVGEEIVLQQGQYIDGKRSGVWTQKAPGGGRVEFVLDESGEPRSWRAWYADGQPAYRYRYHQDEWTRWDRRGRQLEHRVSTGGRTRWVLTPGECPFPFAGTPTQVSFIESTREDWFEATCSGQVAPGPVQAVLVRGRYERLGLRFSNVTWKREIWRAVLRDGGGPQCVGRNCVHGPSTGVSLLGLRIEPTGIAEARALKELPLEAVNVLATCARARDGSSTETRRYHVEMRLDENGELVPMAARVSELSTGDDSPEDNPFWRCVKAASSGWRISTHHPAIEATASYTFAVGRGMWVEPAVPRIVLPRLCGSPRDPLSRRQGL